MIKGAAGDLPALGVRRRGALQRLGAVDRPGRLIAAAAKAVVGVAVLEAVGGHGDRQDDRLAAFWGHGRLAVRKDDVERLSPGAGVACLDSLVQGGGAGGCGGRRERRGCKGPDRQRQRKHVHWLSPFCGNSKRHRLRFTGACVNGEDGTQDRRSGGVESGQFGLTTSSPRMTALAAEKGEILVTYSVSVDVNKFGVASEAISSAARILAAAGFSPSEIAAFFRRAADDLEGNSRDDLEAAGTIDDEASASFTHYDLIDEYESIPEKKALSRIEKRAAALDRDDTKEALERTLAIVEQALPLAETATAWLIQRCSETGIQVEPNKDEWLQSASDDELDLEDEILFLDDWQINGDFQLHNIEYLARSYARSADIESFGRLVALIRAHKVIYGSDVMAEIEETADALESMAGFVEFVRGHSGSGEITQSSLFDDYIRETGFSGGTHMLEGWLEALAERSEIDRYKRSNRWRVVV